MKIIDAHLHIFPSEPGTDAMARGVGHENSVEHLRQVYGELEIVHGVVMGNRSLETGFHNYPRDLFHYCVGLDSLVLRRGSHIPEDLPDQVEEHLKRENCCGVKLYPGYNRIWLSDPVYEPVYRLAERYDKPAAAAVLEKNPNVCADLSGLLEGRADLDRYFVERAGYVGLLRTWMDYLGCWDRFLYGTDWPIVNLAEYRDYVTRIVPEERRPAVFFDNANRVYGLGL